MADIAVVFHWRPADMDSMTLPELLEWREQAAIRCGEEK